MKKISAIIFHFNEVFNKVYFRTIFYGLHVVTLDFFHIRFREKLYRYIIYFDRSFKNAHSFKNAEIQMQHLTDLNDFFSIIKKKINFCLKEGYPIIFASNVFHNSHLIHKCIQN